MAIRDTLSGKFFAKEEDDLGWNDFCREILHPSDNNEDFPEGAVGIRVDDDFWTVAVLPYEYVGWTLEDVVKDLWPCLEEPRLEPDSGSDAQTISRLEDRVEHLKINIDYLKGKLRDQHDLIEKLQDELETINFGSDIEEEEVEE